MPSAGRATETLVELQAGPHLFYTYRYRYRYIPISADHVHGCSISAEQRSFSRCRAVTAASCHRGRRICVNHCNAQCHSLALAVYTHAQRAAAAAAAAKLPAPQRVGVQHQGTRMPTAAGMGNHGMGTASGHTYAHGGGHGYAHVHLPASEPCAAAAACPHHPRCTQMAWGMAGGGPVLAQGCGTRLDSPCKKSSGG